MGYDVAVVKTTYLDRPDGRAYDFLQELAANASFADWGGSFDSYAFVEYLRENLLTRAREYANTTSLSQQETDDLLAWVEGLPWGGDYIRLRIDW